MKKPILICLMAFLGFAARAQEFDKLDHKKGYKSIKLEDTISNIPKEKLFTMGWDKPDKYGFTQYEYRDSSATHFSQIITLDKVILKFYNGKVFSIKLFYDRVFGDGIKDMFNQAYGSSYKPNQFMKQYYWLGDVVLLSLDYDSTTSPVFAEFESKPLSDLFMAKMKELQNNAAKDF